MQNITELTTMAADATGRMLVQYQDSPGMVAFLEALIAPLQAAEAQAHLLMRKYSVANATGQLLSWKGKLHGCERPPSGDGAHDDTEYRALILAQISSNHSYGRVSDLYAVLSALQAGRPRIYQVYPAGLIVNYTPSPVLGDYPLMRQVLTATKLPVSLDICEHTDSPLGFQGDLEASGFGVGQIGKAL